MQMNILKFIENNSDWEELLSKEPYNLKIVRDDNNVMLKYNQLTSDFSNSIVRECRGLIIQKDKENNFIPVCVPFFKFMNAEEPNSDLDKIDWKTASVQEKVDGSLMKVWYDNNKKKWMISTNGTIDAFKASLASDETELTSYGELFLKCLDNAKADISFQKLTSMLEQNKTYMFEMVSPYNRIVIDYAEPKLYFLGSRDNNTLQEYNPSQEGKILAYFDTPKIYKLNSYEEVKKAANELPWNEEGYVVCDRFFNRVKIKSPEYVMAHYTRTNGVITKERLMNIILENEIDEFLVYASEYKDKLYYLKNKRQEFIEDINTIIYQIKLKSFDDRKSLAMYIQSQFPQFMHQFLFSYNKDNRYDNIKASKWIELLDNYEKYKQGEQ